MSAVGVRCQRAICDLLVESSSRFLAASGARRLGRSSVRAGLRNVQRQRESDSQGRPAGPESGRFGFAAASSGIYGSRSWPGFPL